MSDWLERLTTKLEPLLGQEDPRRSISAYHDMPYAIFRYPAEEEFALRKELSLLRTRLEQKGKRVSVISLAERLQAAITAESSTGDLVESEKTIGLTQVIDTVHEILSRYKRLDDLVVERMPASPDPLRDIVFIVRAGALFPVYRTSSLLEQLKGRVVVPSVLFFPGELDGAAGLRFMGVLDAEHNYRPMIF
ncbi:MAG: BREX protein BrxB domain-containing protein [Planctomycetota bacterium]